MSFSGILPRLLTGSLVLALLGLALYSGQPGMFLLGFLLGMLALWEFYSLFWPGRERLGQKAGGLFLCAVLFAAGAARMVSTAWTPGIVAGALMLAFLLLACGFLFRYGLGDDEARLPGYALVLAGLVYVPLPIVLALCLLDRLEILMLLAVVTVADSAAYFAGNVWGKHKVWPRVSPKKSVEGCLGGLVGTVIVVMVFGALTGRDWRLDAVLGIVLAFAAMFGDFFESALKRAYGVKDSGVILPGHGGALDRIDSFLFVAPVYLIAGDLWQLLQGAAG